MHKLLVCGLLLGFAALSFGVAASETTTYVYDELGRLVAVNNSGGPRNGKSALTSYDPVGNRSTQAVGVAPPPPNNAAVFTVSGPPAAVDEGQSATFTVSKTGPASATLSVNYTTVNGSAAAPSDFAAASGTLAFLSWETAKTVSIPIIEDGVAEGAESFSLQLSSPSSGASIGSASASATIAAHGAPNQPPITVPDSGSMNVCSNAYFNVVANDNDPEGNTPIVLLSVTHTGGLGVASVFNSTTVRFQSFGSAGTAGVTYTVRDSLGATSGGLLEVTIQDLGGCN